MLNNMQLKYAFKINLTVKHITYLKLKKGKPSGNKA